MSEIPADVMKAAEAVMNAPSPSMDRAIFQPLHATIRRQATEAIARAIMAERERCAAFAFAKHDWPARWIAASFRGENSAYHDFEPHLEAEPHAPAKVT